jgi:hypothetical protein
MNEGLKGKTFVTTSRRLHEQKLDELAAAIDSPTAAETATLAPFFGPSILGDGPIVDFLGIDLSRALLGSLDYLWERPFRPDELVRVEVVVEDVFEKSGMRFVVVRSDFTDETGNLIQTQRATFIERGAA